MKSWLWVGTFEYEQRGGCVQGYVRCALALDELRELKVKDNGYSRYCEEGNALRNGFFLRQSFDGDDGVGDLVGPLALVQA